MNAVNGKRTSKAFTAKDRSEKEIEEARVAAVEHRAALETKAFAFKLNGAAKKK